MIHLEGFALLKRGTEIAERFGIPASFVRRALARYVLRITILDPINVGLLAVAVVIWAQWL